MLVTGYLLLDDNIEYPATRTRDQLIYKTDRIP